MWNLVKNYIKFVKVLPIKSLISVYGSNNISSFSPNYFVKFLARTYIIKDNLLKCRPLTTQNILNEKNGSDKCYNSFQSQLWNYKNLTSFPGKFKILNENVAQSEYSNAFQSSRYYSTENNENTPEVKKNMLMNFPLMVWPNIFNTTRCFLFSYFVVRTFYEEGFSLSEFCNASKQALMKVSNILSQGDLSGLKNFVDEKALKEIKENISGFSVKERLDLAVDAEDVFMRFPYQIALIYSDDEKEKSKRVFLEITVCYHIFRGFKDYVENKLIPNVKSSYDKEDRVSIANYRFVREITKGSEDDWTITILNHFKPIKLAARF